MLVISTQNWSILAKFAQKNPAKSAAFYWLFLGDVEVSPEISRESSRFFWAFAPENASNFDFLLQNPSKSADFSANFDFSPAKTPRNRLIFSWILTFSRENPAKSADFSANLPLKIPRNFRSPTIATDNRKQFQCLNIILNKKTRSLFLKFNWCEKSFSFLKR